MQSNAARQCGSFCLHASQIEKCAGLTERNRVPGDFAQANVPQSAPVAPFSVVDRIVERPAAGEVRVIDIVDARTLKFAFPISEVTVSILDIDAVLIFPNGGKIIMPSFALQIVSDRPPMIQFNNTEVDPQSLLANAGDIRFFEQIPQLAVADSQRSQTGGDGNQSGSAQAVQLPSAQQFASTPLPVQRTSVSDPSAELSVNRPASEFGKRVVSQPSVELRSEGALVERSDRAGDAPQDANPAPSITSDGGADATSTSVFENAAFIKQFSAVDPNGENVYFAVAGGADASEIAPKVPGQGLPLR